MTLEKGYLTLAVLLGVSSAFQSAAFAEERQKHVDSEVSYVTGKLLYQTEFPKVDLDDAPWSVQHGQWHVSDGALAGETKDEENHDASISLMIQVPEDLLVSMKFKLAADETFTLCFIGGPGPHGRVHINARECYLRMKAGDTGAARVLDYLPLELVTNEWHTLTFIRQGDRLVATIDNEHRIAGRHGKFIHSKKRINLCSESSGTRFDAISIARLSEFRAAPKLFSKPGYSLSEFWSMREEEYGLVRPKNEKKDKNE